MHNEIEVTNPSSILSLFVSLPFDSYSWENNRIKREWKIFDGNEFENLFLSVKIENCGGEGQRETSSLTLGQAS